MQALLAGLVVAAAVVPITTASARSIYVASDDNDNVVVINSDTNAIEGSGIGVGDEPRGLAVTPNGSRIYVTNRAANSISVIDASSRTTVTTINIPLEGIVEPHPENVAISPDGTRAYVANDGTHDVAVIDVASNTIVGDIEMGSLLSPQDIVVTPDGAHAYVTAVDTFPDTDDSIRIIDTASSSVSGSVTIPVGSGPSRLAITPDGKKIYVSLTGIADAAVVDTATNTITNFLSLPGTPDAPIPVAVTADGSRALISDFDLAKSWSVNTADDSSSLISGLPRSAAIGVLPNSSRAYFAGVNLDTVGVLEVATNGVLAGVSGGPSDPRGLAVAPDQGPTATFTTATATAGAATTFNGTASTDSDGTITRYDWNFGDGTTVDNGGAQLSHTFQKAGSYDVSLTVTDNEGASTTRVFTGQTVSLNGSAAARKTASVTVAADKTKPKVKITSPRKSQRKMRGSKFKRLRGTASDAAGIKHVKYAIGRRMNKKGQCRFMQKNGRLARKSKRCTRPRYLKATGTTKWSAKLKRKLPRGRYFIFARATDNQGLTSKLAKQRIKVV